MAESIAFYVLMILMTFLVIVNLLVGVFMASLLVKLSDKMRSLSDYLSRIPIAEVTSAPKPSQNLIDLMRESGGDFHPGLVQLAAQQLLNQ